MSEGSTDIDPRAPRDASASSERAEGSAPIKHTFVGVGPSQAPPAPVAGERTFPKTTLLGPGPAKPIEDVIERYAPPAAIALARKGIADQLPASSPPPPSPAEPRWSVPAPVQSQKATMMGSAASVRPPRREPEGPAPVPSQKATMMGTAASVRPPRTETAPPPRTRRTSAPPELAEGTVFAGEYKIQKRLARGGMGSVYEAEQVSTGRRRALKILHRAHSGDERLRQRFVQEARITAPIESEHLVDVVGAGVDETSGAFWMAMELLEGETLADHLVRLGPGAPMRDEHAWRVLTQLARGLAHAHQQGVVHRDLKPANIFLAKSDPFTVKILDFGIAHLLGDDEDGDGPVGTPLWMAPEQAAGGEATPATDVWAVGLLAFRLFSGRSYWLAARRSVVDGAALLAEMRDRPLPTASERAEVLGCPRHLPDGFDAWFARCVARDPKLRFRTADEMAIALEAIVPRAAPVPVLEYTPSAPRALGSPRGAQVRDATHAPVPSPERSEALVVLPRYDTPVVTTPVLAVRPSQRPPREAEVTPDSESMVRARPLELRATPAPEPAAPATTSAPQSAVATVKLAPTEPPPVLRTPVVAGAVFGVLVAVGALVYSRQTTRAPVAADDTPAEVGASDAPRTPAAPSWVTGSSRVWNGRLTSGASQWSFVLVLRQVEGDQVSGHILWTAARAPSARPGEQVRENVEGTYDATTGALDLHGTVSTNPFVLPVNAYQLQVSASGALEGSTIDPSTRITGSLARGRR